MRCQRPPATGNAGPATLFEPRALVQGVYRWGAASGLGSSLPIGPSCAKPRFWHTEHLPEAGHMSHTLKASLALLCTCLTLSACTRSPLPTPSPAPTPTATRAPLPTPPAPKYDPEPICITVCSSGCDFVSVQAAIDDAGTSANDVITVTDAVHTEAGIIANKDVTIQGLGADRTIVQAHANLLQALDRVFIVPERTRAAIQGMTIRHGHPYERPLSGGGVANYGELTLVKSVVRDNSANDGGGIFNHGTMTILDCSVHANLADREAPPGLQCGSGGGIKNGFGATLYMENSAVHRNRALGKAGGLFVACEGAAWLTNCTFSGNLADRDGGGVYVKGDAEITHCTIFGNSTKPQGGGLYVRSQATLTNSLIAGKLPGDVVVGGPGGYQGKGVLNADVYNWIADRSCESDFSGDPLLDRLGDNGGDTLTHALLPDSPAIDATPATACSVPNDQRGQSRPVEVGSGQPLCDVGAYEAQP